MSIIILRPGARAARVPLTEFALESTMQEQLSANPNILPLHEIRPGAELVAVVRELGVSTGYIDLLGFDADGEIYVIETKLARNPDRRTVLAQALDYGAALWTGFNEPDAFFGTIDAQLSRERQPALQESLRAAHDGDDEAAARSVERIAQNLANGVFRFVVPMDRITESMKSLVRFVNENSRFTLYLVELEQYQTDDVTVVVPRLFGAEARKPAATGPTTSSRGVAGSAADFQADVEHRTAAGELSSDVGTALQQILGIVSLSPGRHRWVVAPGGRVNVSPRFPSTGLARSPFTLRSDGRLMLNLGYLDENPVWVAWARRVLRLLQREDESRAYPEYKPSEWVAHWHDIVDATRQAASGETELS